MLSFSSYFSPGYLALYLPAAVLLYAVAGQRGRRAVLLLFSYVCFWAVSGKLIAYLLLSTLSMYHTGRWLAHEQARAKQDLEEAPKEERRALRARAQTRQRRILALGLLFQLGMLVVLKYTPFFFSNFNALFHAWALPITLRIPYFLLPIGISFYTMQAASYLFDVYRQKIPADRNLFRLALYLSFFPLLMEGPICRYEQTAQQLWNAPALRYQNFLLGLQRMSYGLIKKILVADRLNLLIKTVFDHYEDYDGLVIAVAAVCYTIQLYMDFSGTMDLAVGAGRIFGFQIPENFQRPFFSRSIPEFWQRWHISLGTWFKDYIFYPLSMSKPLKKLTTKARKRLGSHYGPLVAGSIALFCVWLCNGLWHGAAWNYIFFGLYHFALILMGNLTQPLTVKLTDRLGVSRTSIPYQGFQIVRTGVLVCIGELFFRANGLHNGLAMFHKMVTQFSFESIRDQSLFTLGMGRKDFLIVAILMGIIFLVSLMQERGVHLGTRLLESPVLVRVAVYYGVILALVIFGAYGAGYVPVDPIYAGF